MDQQTIQNHIQQLIDEDEKSQNLIDGYYQQALDEIRNHLNAFFVRYARESHLTIAEVEARVQLWDIQQLKNAIDLVDDTNKSDIDKEVIIEANKRVEKAKATSMISKKELLLSLSALAVIKATVKTNDYVQKRIKYDVKREIKFRQFKKRRPPRLTDVNAILSKRLWTDCDSINGVVEYLVNKTISGNGIGAGDIQMLLPYMKDSAKPLSVTKYLKQLGYRATRVMRTESQRAIDDVVMQNFRDKKVKLVDIVNEPGACDTCISISSKGPYTLHDCPDIPLHPNCRCGKVEHSTI